MTLKKLLLEVDAARRDGKPLTGEVAEQMASLHHRKQSSAQPGDARSSSPRRGPTSLNSHHFTPHTISGLVPPPQNLTSRSAGSGQVNRQGMSSSCQQQGYHDNIVDTHGQAASVSLPPAPSQGHYASEASAHDPQHRLQRTNVSGSAPSVAAHAKHRHL
jgi:hypothetical protein